MEKTDYNLHQPELDAKGQGAAGPRGAKVLEGDGDLDEDRLEKVLEMAAEQDRVEGNEVVHAIFEEDPEWTLKIQQAQMPAGSWGGGLLLVRGDEPLDKTAKTPKRNKAKASPSKPIGIHKTPRQSTTPKNTKPKTPTTKARKTPKIAKMKKVDKASTPRARQSRRLQGKAPLEGTAL